jgi:hypothetical protein
LKPFSTIRIFACALLATAVAVDGTLYAHAQGLEPLVSNSPSQSGGQNNDQSSSTTGVQGQSASALSGLAAGQHRAVVLRFAVASGAPGAPPTLSEQACPIKNGASAPTAYGPSSSAAKPEASLSVDPKLQDQITAELQKRLSKKMPVSTDVEPTAIPVGALVISGCITRANGGKAAERLAGLNLGSSHLEAHVKVLSRTETGYLPVDEFDVQAKGGKLLPPLGPVGLATHAVAERRETLSADAKKLADELLKKLAKTMKSQAQAAKTV